MNRILASFTPDRPARFAGVRSFVSRRRLPIILLLAGTLTVTPGLIQGAGATGCYLVPSSVRVSGGFATNVTVVNAEANGGVAAANAPGGDDNLALGFFGNASAGNGGMATAAANGGAITLGDINSGGNVGNVIRVHSYLPVSCVALSSWILVNGGYSGNLPSGLVVNGGSSSNLTSINPEANGGVAIANAAGGDGNLALGILGNANAGNGGTANAQANGGTISLGNVNSGGNTGNVLHSDGLSDADMLGGGGTLSGGASSNATTVNPEANGGLAAANAPGGDNNLAVGVLGDAAAGNGGTANASANGGEIEVGDVNSGQNVGNVIETDGLSGSSGTTDAHGGYSSNETAVNPEANGGAAIGNAEGGDDNAALGVLGDASAGNGGTADASANGGSIAVGDVNSGQNAGNVIDAGN